MVPTVELPPVTLLTCQVTPVLVVPVTVPVNCWVLPAVTLALVGLTDTATDGVAEMFTVALAEAVVLAALVAVTVTLPPEGAVPGAT
jgi:hypothetical protein